ncbi:MAG: response regulator [Alphaproteobacteria bacterium]|nr:response regulator [Alphaproteobacteria bacterium]
MARILIIDDEELLRETIAQVLDDAGFETREASDGEEGIDKFRKSPSDLVITDILMPTKEGIETIRELRRLSSGVKIIAMSGGGHLLKTSYLDVARQLGANVVLKKPFEMRALLDAVNTCLEAAER